ncbi:MAG TPA: hypothetical protein VFC90_00205 [Planctomycetota bacterium]|nr:hypothetical protein [Planctomycetota bacterium]
MKTYWLTLALVAALGVTMALPGPALTEERHARPEIAVTTDPAVHAGLPRTGETRSEMIEGYGQRELQARDLESFEGGRRHEDVVIISCGALALVIVILILI